MKYAIVDEHGPDHNKVFVAEVTHDGAVLGKGSGKSKKEAEQNAANDALERMNQAKNKKFRKKINFKNENDLERADEGIWLLEVIFVQKKF